MKNKTPTYKVPVKERLRRFKVRLKTLFNIPEYSTYKVNGKVERFKKLSNTNIPVKIPNFWYTPFEEYLLAHLQRTYFIMTCNEYAYVDAGMTRLTSLYPKNGQELFHGWDMSQFAGTIEMYTKADGSLAVKKSNGQIEILRENETKTNSNN